MAASRRNLEEHETKRRKGPKGNFGGALCQGGSEASDEDVEESEEEEIEEADDAQTKSKKKSLNKAKAEEAEAKRKKQKERFEDLGTVQRLVEHSWQLLEIGCRSELLCFAAENISLGLRNIFQESIEEGRDEDISTVGMPYFLAQELSRMQLGLASRQRFVSWSSRACSMILQAFEVQTGLCRAGNTAYRHFGKIVCTSKSKPEMQYPSTAPSLSDCQRLHQWKKARGYLRWSKMMMMTTTTTTFFSCCCGCPYFTCFMVSPT